jgi:hypothetical protein
MEELVHQREEQTKSCIALNADVVWSVLRSEGAIQLLGMLGGKRLYEASRSIV